MDEPTSTSDDIFSQPASDPFDAPFDTVPDIGYDIADPGHEDVVEPAAKAKTSVKTKTTPKSPSTQADFDFDAETDAVGLPPVIADSSGVVVSRPAHPKSLSDEGTEATDMAAFSAAFNIPVIVRWKTSDYDTVVDGSGAEKLVDSAVAPLVAQARGFSMLTSKQLTQFCHDNGLNRTTKQGRRLSTAVRVADVLTMPWYSIDAIAAEPDTTEHTAMQFRPGVPERDDKGKERKYEFITGAQTPIGVHPATPTDWFDNSPTVMIAEGMLKGDVAVSAMLLDAGVTPEELKVAVKGGAREKLRELFDRVPVQDRVLILGIAGVYNWRNNSEWRSIRWDDRTCWIAFDGDTASNYNVWAQAKELAEYIETKHAKVKYLSPNAVTGEDGSVDKTGIDDYLAKLGTWKTLLPQVAPTLPPRPAKKNEAKIGSWRVAPSGTTVQECVPDMDPSGNKTDKAKWVERVDIGGRIISVDAHRHATSEEQRTGIFGRGVEADAIEVQVEIELSWENLGNVETAVVKGSEALLNYSPDQWHRHKAYLPSELLLHPSWPPQKGLDWLAAIKGHRTEERVERVVWKSAGWVPVPGNFPVFIVGKQVIGGDGLSEQALSGISEAMLSSSTKFGFEDDPREFDDTEHLKQVKADLEAVMEKYIYAGVWTELSTAAICLAAAMRPVLPVRPRSTIYFVGAKGTGKTWAAQNIMSFWSSNGVWWESLPGSATDTMNSTEYAVSRTPLWVVDDLAPSPDRRSMEKESKALEDIIRGQFNGTSKRRMGPDGTTRETSSPKALLVATAENELTTGSIKERIISVSIRTGSLHPSREVTDELVKWSSESGIPSRLTSAFAKYIRHRASTNPAGWQGEISDIMKRRDQANKEAGEWLKEHNAITENTTRAGLLAGDLIVALEYLKEMATEVGCAKKILKELASYQIEKGGMAGAVVSTVAESHQSKTESAPGRAAAIAIRAILTAGKAHIASAEDASRPPATGVADNFINASLGWEYAGDVVRPKGVKIGWMVKHKDRDFVLLDADTAFTEAHRHHPELISFGQTKSAAWSGMWDEGIAEEVSEKYPNGWTRVERNNRKPNTVQGRAGDMRPRGVPIELSVLLNGGQRVSETDNAAAGE